MKLQDAPDPAPPVTGWHPDPLQEADERYWESTWTTQVRSPDVPATTASVDAAQRKAILAGKIAEEVGRGFRVESQSDFQAILVSGNRVNHILHLILSVLTLGIWLIVWIIMAVGGGERRKVISVNEYGQAVETRS